MFSALTFLGSNDKMNDTPVTAPPKTTAEIPVMQCKLIWFYDIRLAYYYWEH